MSLTLRLFTILLLHGVSVSIRLTGRDSAVVAVILPFRHEESQADDKGDADYDSSADGDSNDGRGLGGGSSDGVIGAGRIVVAVQDEVYRGFPKLVGQDGVGWKKKKSAAWSRTGLVVVVVVVAVVVFEEEEEQPKHTTTIAGNNDNISSNMNDSKQQQLQQ